MDSSPTDIMMRDLLVSVRDEVGALRQEMLKQIGELKARVAPIPATRLHARLISLTEAARRLGIHRGPNMDYLVETGQLPLTKIQGRSRPKVAAAEVERLIREGFKLPRL